MAGSYDRPHLGTVWYQSTPTPSHNYTRCASTQLDFAATMSPTSTDHDASSRDSSSSAEDRDAISCDSVSSAEDSEDWVDIPAKPQKPSRLSLSLRNNPFVDTIFRLADGTRWKILKPLWLLEFQEDFSPCEARQVYTCVCLDKPWKDIGECRVKIKFQ